jgi:hypothetical protein
MSSKEMRAHRLVWMLLGTLAAATSAAGDDRSEGQELPPLDQVDSNRDGEISRSEAETIAGLDFDAADANKNNSIDRSEYLAYASDRAGR